MNGKVALMAGVVAAAMLFAASGAANASVYAYEISDYNPGGDGAVTGYVTLDVVAGQVTDGSAMLTGGMLPYGWTDFSLVTVDNYCSGTCTGWRTGGGADLFGGDTNFPIDSSGLIFHSALDGDGYVFGLYTSGPGTSGNDLAALFGPGGPKNYYTLSDGLTLSAVPEPATWALMVLGFAAVGFAGYRKSREARAITV